MSVLVIWSESSIASDWVKDEASVGKMHETLLAVAIDGVNPPLGFRQLQTVHIERTSDWSQSDAFARLSAELTRRCASADT